LADFDRHAEDYNALMEESVGWTGLRHESFVAAKARLLRRLLRQHVADPAKASVLDVGCGIGLIDRHLAPDVGELCGIDLSADCVETAARGCPEATFLPYDGRRIPYDEGRFDFAFAICVVHHVPPQAWKDFAAEMARVLKPGGVAAIIEHNPYNPVARHMVKHCPFDHDAVLLNLSQCGGLLKGAGLKLVKRAYTTFIPVPSPVVEAIESGLAWLPLGGQYLVAGKKT